MKKIIAIILITICGIINGYSQTLSLTTTSDFFNIPHNAYVKDVDGKLDPFLGMWRWTDGNAEFIVQFVKKPMYNGFVGKPWPYKIDTVLGGYKYTLNGNVIVNTLNFTTEANINDASTFQNYATIVTDIIAPFDYLYLNFDDRGSVKRGKGNFTLVDPLTLANGNFSATTAHWKVYVSG